MRSPISKNGLVAALWLAACGYAQAGSIRVEPVLVDVAAPGAATTLTLQNTEDKAVEAQIRVFRWTQAAGKESLEPTDDVVVSPPAASLAPGQQYVVRVVRVTKRPVAGEESYRVLIDELPDSIAANNSRTVNLLVRQSVPVFFGQPQRSDATLAWSIVGSGKSAAIVATNNGDSRMRVAGLSIQPPGGKAISFGAGLVGYVLGRSTMRWPVPNNSERFAAGGSVSISALSEKGPIHALAQVQQTE
jgi:fimbrial chaperone protein